MDDLIDHYQNTDDLIKSCQLSSSGSNNSNTNNNNNITLFVDTIEYEAKVTIVAKSTQQQVYLVKIVSTDEDNEDDDDDEKVIKEQEYRAESLLRVTQQVLEELSAVRDDFLEKVLSLLFFGCFLMHLFDRFLSSFFLSGCCKSLQLFFFRCFCCCLIFWSVVVRRRYSHTQLCLR